MMTNPIEPKNQSLGAIYQSLAYFLNVISPAILSEQEEEYFGIQWIKSYQVGNLPKRPFGTLYIETSSDLLSYKNARCEYNSETGIYYEVMSNSAYIDLNLSVFGENADDIIIKYFLTFETLEAKHHFYKNGYSFMGKERNINKTKLVNKVFEDRSSVTIRFFTVFENYSVIETIETFNIKSKLYVEGKFFSDDTITINKE